MCSHPGWQSGCLCGSGRLRFIQVERLGMFQKALLMFCLHEVASSGKHFEGLGGALDEEKKGGIEMA
eukprot:75419-Pelagomonas_calceolata.AAC.1